MRQSVFTNIQDGKVTIEEIREKLRAAKSVRMRNTEAMLRASSSSFSGTSDNSTINKLIVQQRNTIGSIELSNNSGTSKKSLY
jgi:hypothetical protein